MVYIAFLVLPLLGAVWFYNLVVLLRNSFKEFEKREGHTQTDRFRHCFFLYICVSTDLRVSSSALDHP